jgi:hypothetical protein
MRYRAQGHPADARNGIGKFLRKFGTGCFELVILRTRALIPEVSLKIVKLTRLVGYLR